MKTRLFAALLTILILLTACSTAGTSSGTSQAPVSSKAEVSSVAEVSSAATSSAKPVQYMSYEEYFSEQRKINAGYEYFRVDDHHLYDGDTLVLPFPPEGLYGAVLGKYAQTPTGLLYLIGVNLYRITKANQKAELIYIGRDECEYAPCWISRDADEYVLFMIERSRVDDSKFEVTRMFRPTGQVDVVATNAEIPGDVYYLEPYSNMAVRVFSLLPYERDPNWSEDEWNNQYAAHNRVTLVNMETGEVVCNSDNDAFIAAGDRLPKFD